MKNDCLDIALAELEAAGIRDVVIARGSKHPQLQFKINGGPLRIFAVPGTPSDHRSPANTRRDLRRLLREVGVLLPPEPKAAARPPDRLTLLERRLTAIEQVLGMNKPKPAIGEPENIA
jgi:hypothetical protein